MATERTFNVPLRRRDTRINFAMREANKLKQSPDRLIASNILTRTIPILHELKTKVSLQIAISLGQRRIKTLEGYASRYGPIWERDLKQVQTILEENQRQLSKLEENIKKRKAKGKLPSLKIKTDKSSSKKKQEGVKKSRPIEYGPTNEQRKSMTIINFTDAVLAAKKAEDFSTLKDVYQKFLHSFPNNEHLDENTLKTIAIEGLYQAIKDIYQKLSENIELSTQELAIVDHIHAIREREPDFKVSSISTVLSEVLAPTSSPVTVFQAVPVHS